MEGFPAGYLIEIKSGLLAIKFSLGSLI